MWLTVVFFCTSMAASDCSMMANTEKLWMTEKQCDVDGITMSMTLRDQGYFSRYACLKVGESV